MQFLFPAGFIYHPQCHWGAIIHSVKRGKSSGNKRREQRKIVLFVLLRQHTDGWAISGHRSTVQTFLLTQASASASPEFQMWSSFAV